MLDQADAPPQLRAFRYALDPTDDQLTQLAQHAGAARWAYNHALAAKVAAHQLWRAEVDKLLDAGLDDTQARAQVRVPTPSKPTIQKAWNLLKGDDRTGADGVSPWWHVVSTYCFQSAFADADTAWKNWVACLAGTRAGPRMGYPRFKKKGRARDSFRLHHDVKTPTIRLSTYRRLRVPRVGELRLHGTAKRLARLINHGQALIQSVTISRTGHRWYASVLCKVDQPPAPPSRAQRAAGTVGVDLGVKHLAALSTGEITPNPRYLDRAARRLLKAQRALARTSRGSAGRGRARAHLARVYAEIAEHRATALHTLTKKLATSWQHIAIEDLNVAGMTRSSRGTVDQPGRNVAAKAGLNRRLLDASFGEIRRQLTYKTSWYGSTLTVIDRWAPTSKTCSACGQRKPSLTLTERTFTCDTCGLVLDRDVNAAKNIAAIATAAPAASPAAVASGTGETRNARREAGRPPGRTPSPTREGTHVPPQRSDPLAPSTRAKSKTPAT